MKRKPYPLKRLRYYYRPNKITNEIVKISDLLFEDPKLLSYSIKIPASMFNSELLKNENSSSDEFVIMKMNEIRSDKHDVIFSGNSSYVFTKFHDNKEKGKNQITGVDYRFELMLEQYAIISLSTTLETFVKTVLQDHQKHCKLQHYFGSVENAMKQCGIIVKNLEGFQDESLYETVQSSIDIIFWARNLYVHNGGIIDERFRKYYRRKIQRKRLGKLLRINYDEYTKLRQHMSYFIQEVCRVLTGYEDVWSDYLLSIGIVLHDPSMLLLEENGQRIEIPLDDGREIEVQVGLDSSEEIT